MSRAGFPRCDAIKRRWKKYFISSAASLPQRRASCRASSLRKTRTSLSHPPNDSTTRGWEWIPWERQLSKCARFLATFRASMAAAELWSGTNKDRDVSTGPLARPFDRSLAPLTCSLARSLRSLPCSLAHFPHSLARGKVNY